MSFIQENGNLDDLTQFAKTCLRNEFESRTSQSGCGIIYCRTRKDTEFLSTELCRRGVKCKAYHAGLKV
jgi:ATP-dependent DNA helicase Q5